MERRKSRSRGASLGIDPSPARRPSTARISFSCLVVTGSRHSDLLYPSRSSSALHDEQRSIVVKSPPHHGDFRAAPRANRTCSTADTPTPGAASSTDEPPSAVPWRSWRSFDLSPPPHHQVKILAAPFGKTAHRNLRRLHRTIVFTAPMIVPYGEVHYGAFSTQPQSRKGIRSGAEGGS